MSEQQTLVLPVEEGRKMVDDGVHVGAIIEIKPKNITVRETGEQVPYVDIIFTVEDVDANANPIYQYKDENGQPQLQTLKLGCSQKITTNSNLGKLLTQLGVNLEAGAKLDVVSIVGTKVTYQTIQKEGTNKDGQKQMYSNIMLESVKKGE